MHMTDIQNIDKEAFKALLAEVLNEHPEYLREALKDIIDAKQKRNQSSGSDSQKGREIQVLLDEEFKKYEEVFKALA